MDGRFQLNWNARSRRPARRHQLSIPAALRLPPRREQYSHPWRKLWSSVRRSRVPTALSEEGHVAQGGQLVLLKGRLRKTQGKQFKFSLTLDAQCAWIHFGKYNISHAFFQNFADIVSLLFLNAVPTAGNFFVVRYSFETTDKFLCIVSKCTKSPFPTNIAGVNSGPSCGTKNKFA